MRTEFLKRIVDDYWDSYKQYRVADAAVDANEKYISDIVEKEARKKYLLKTFDSSKGSQLKVIGFTTKIYRGLLTLSLLAIKVDVNPTNAEKKLLDKLHGLPENASFDKVVQNELERIHWDLRLLKNELAVILEYDFDLSSSVDVEKLQNLRLKI